jgi:hypothetical protein
MNMIKSLFSWFNVVFLLVGIIIGLLVGWFFFSPKTQEKEVITSRTVLEKVSTKGMLVTQSVIVDQKAIIKVDQGSEWSNFWWGYEVNARANMKVDVGVDLSKLREDDIIVNSLEKTVCFRYPNAEITSVTIEGDIEAETKSGILKRIIDSNSTRDYNLALNKLKEEVSKNVESQDEIMKNARNAADNSLAILFYGTDFKTVNTCRQ